MTTGDEPIHCGKCSCIRPCGATSRSSLENKESSVPEETVYTVIGKAIQEAWQKMWKSKP